MLITLLSATVFSNLVHPEFVTAIPATDLPATMFVGLSNSLITISAGLALSTVVMYRQAIRPTKVRSSLALAVGGMASALLATYSGLRFQYDMAQQLRFSAPDFDAVLSRLHFQGLMAVAQASFLCLLAVRHHYHRDRRHALD